MALTIYHNPDCSKSRKTLEIVSNSDAEVCVIQYLEDAPDAATILDIAAILKLSVADLLRQGESEFKDANDLPDLGDDAALADWLAQHPIALERPIVVDNDSGKAVIGRPPENVHQLLPNA